jgi:hypothetical protein
VTALLISFQWSHAEVITDELVSAVIQVESGGNPNAVGKAGEIGLMQISPIVLKEWNNFIKNIDSEKMIYWLDIGTSDLLHTDNEAHYGWESTDKKGWYLRVPRIKNGIFLDLYSCPIEDKYLFDSRINILIGTWYLRRLKDHYLRNITIMQKLDKDKFFMFGFGDMKIGEKRNVKPIKLKKYGVKNVKDAQLALILAAYNGGISHLKKVGYDINKMPRSTRNYVKKVFEELVFEEMER